MLILGALLHHRVASAGLGAAKLVVAVLIDKSAARCASAGSFFWLRRDGGIPALSAY